MNSRANPQRIFLRLSKTRVVLLGLKNHVFKCPITAGGSRETRLEILKRTEVQNDPFFRKYLPMYRTFGPVHILPRMIPVKADDHLIGSYFRKAFSGWWTWQKQPLQDLVEANALFDFVLGNRRMSSFLERFLSLIQLPSSSSHGDFHVDNILRSNGGLYFIDWSNYSHNSCRLFDLIHFLIYLSPLSSWIDTVGDLLVSNERPICTFDIEITDELLLAYGLWRIGKELRVRQTLFGKVAAGRRARLEGLLRTIQQFSTSGAVRG